MEIATGRRK